MLRGTSLMPYIQLLQTVQPLWKYDVAFWVRSLRHNRDAGVQLPTLHILRNEFHGLVVTTSTFSSSVSGFNSRCHHSLEDAGKGNPGSRRPTIRGAVETATFIAPAWRSWPFDLFLMPWGRPPPWLTWLLPPLACPRVTPGRVAVVPELLDDDDMADDELLDATLGGAADKRDTKLLDAKMADAWWTAG